MRKDIFDLTDKLTIFRIDFRESVKNIKKEYEETKKKIPNEYIGKRRDEEYKKAEEKYNNDLKELRETWSKDLIEEFDDMESRARSKAGVINSQLLEQVRVFLNMPVTTEEFGAITHALGNRNYYVDRVLETIAEKNGITKNGLTPLLEPLELEPSLDVKLSVLADLKKQAMDIIENYGTINEDINARTGDLFPDVLRRAEQIYTNGLYNGHLTAKQIADRVIDTIRYGGGHGSHTIDNALENADKKTKRALLNALCNSKENEIMYAIQKSKSKTEINIFKQNESELYTKAEMGMDKLYRVIDDKTACDSVIKENSTNPYFNELLEDDATLRNRIGLNFVENQRIDTSSV